MSPQFHSVSCSRINGTAVCQGLAGKRVVVHSPDGYEWGYGGSGPADLALNILTRVFPTRSTAGQGITALRRGVRVSIRAADLYQHFKRDVIARMPRDLQWRLFREDVERWAAAHDRNEREANAIGHELMIREYDRDLARVAS